MNGIYISVVIHTDTIYTSQTFEDGEDSAELTALEKNKSSVLMSIR